MRNLVLVLGDQLDRRSAAFDGFDPAADRVWMAEARHESTPIDSSKTRLALFLACMRHFRDGLRAEGITVEYHPLAAVPRATPGVAGALIAPTAGEVRILGQRIDGLTQSERGIVRLRHFGFVFQSYNLFPTLTAQENVEVALDLRGTPLAARRRIAREALDAVGLADRAGSYPAKLSGGQKQRVAIARALAGEPDIVLADEPTAALDSESGKRIVALLVAIAADRGRGVVVVTHDPRIVDAADRIVRIEDGRIVQTETRKASQERSP